MRTLSALSAALLLAACASAPPAPPLPATPAAGTAHFVLLRPDGRPYLGLDARVAVDGRLVAKVSPEAVVTVPVAAGTRRVRVDTAGAPGHCELDIEFAEGGTQHAEIGPRPGAVAQGAAWAGPTLALATMLFRLGAATADAAGQACGGPFALRPLDAAQARERIAAGTAGTAVR